MRSDTTGGGNILPGFFLYGKKQRKWLEINKLSTEHAKLGHYSTLDAFVSKEKTNGKGVIEMEILSKKTNMPVLAIGWDYRSFANVEYADIPLNPLLSIGFPDKITYDNKNESYIFSFGSSYNNEEMLTEFWVRKDDLKHTFR